MSYGPHRPLNYTDEQQYIKRLAELYATTDSKDVATLCQIVIEMIQAMQKR